MNSNFIKTLIVATVVNSWAVPVFSQQTDNINIGFSEHYKEAIPLERVAPKYPSRMALENREGWVDMTFMVDVTGETYEIGVEDHSHGGEDFVDAVRKSIEKYKFSPATQNGEPVDSSQSIRIFFNMEGDAPGVSIRFKKHYTNFQKAIAEKNIQEAEDELSSLRNSKGMSLYDDAFLNLASFMYEKEFGTPENQLKYLSKIFSNVSSRYFDDNLYTSLLTTVFGLEVKQMHLDQALETYKRLSRRKNTKELLTKLDGTVEQIKAMKYDDTSYPVKGQIDESGYWDFVLYKNAFKFDNIKGELNEFKLRCSTKYLFLAYEQDKVYEIPKDYGRCFLSVYGKADTSFNLVQQASSIE